MVRAIHGAIFADEGALNARPQRVVQSILRTSGLSTYKTERSRRVIHLRQETIMPRFHVSCQIEYIVAIPSTLILNIHPQCNGSQTVVEERFVVKPQVKTEEFTTP